MSGTKWGEFLNEQIWGDRGNENRLRSWRDDGEIVVWIHTNTLIHKRLFHLVPYVAEKEDDKGRKKRVIYYYPFVCHESVEDYIQKTPPSRCPICRLRDWLSTNGDIDDETTVWESSVGDRQRDRICRKNDFIGDTNAGGDWRLSFKPTFQYVLAVIDNDNVDDGIRVTAEKYSLGEALKKAVRQEIDRKGPELGDPDLNPYAFKWVFDPKARQATDFYSAYPYERATLTDKIKQLLEQPTANLHDWITPGNPNKLLEIMKAHVVVDVDVEQFFDNVIKTSSEAGSPDPEEEAEPVESKVKMKAPAPKPEAKAEPAEKPIKTRTPKSAAPKPTKPEPSSGDADGDNDSDENRQPCPFCKGTGLRKNKDGKEGLCKICDGSGYLEDSSDSEEVKEPKPTVTKQAAPKPPPPDDDEAQCGNCGKSVSLSASACPHCGLRFTDGDDEQEDH